MGFPIASLDMMSSVSRVCSLGRFARDSMIAVIKATMRQADEIWQMLPASSTPTTLPCASDSPLPALQRRIIAINYCSFRSVFFIGQHLLCIITLQRRHRLHINHAHFAVLMCTVSDE